MNRISIQAAICLSGLAIALAMMLTNHWQVIPHLGSSVVRLNRWTGTVTVCATYASGAGTELECTTTP